MVAAVMAVLLPVPASMGVAEIARLCGGLTIMAEHACLVRHPAMTMKFKSTASRANVPVIPVEVQIFKMNAVQINYSLGSQNGIAVGQCNLSVERSDQSCKSLIAPMVRAVPNA
jgi:hypothetical protein